MKATNSFIASTAKDYDLDYDIVQGIYDKFFESGNFYEKLEEEINNINLN